MRDWCETGYCKLKDIKVVIDKYEVYLLFYK